MTTREDDVMAHQAEVAQQEFADRTEPFRGGTAVYFSKRIGAQP